MKFDEMDVTHLLSDESFINYCNRSSQKDVAFWEAYMAENPQNRLLVEYANEKFIELFNVLAQADVDEQQKRLENKLNLMESTPIIEMEGFENKESNNIWSLILKLSSMAAILLGAVFFTIHYFNDTRKNSSKTFVAAYGERKNIQLPDGSDVALNAGSKIEITRGFGVSAREVYLEGEAFFDVKHNASLPFIVHTRAMDVKALGTAFNVKAYGNEKITETSLLRGLVEITLKESNNRIMLLYPNQKIKWERLLAKADNINSPVVKDRGALNIADSLMKKLVLTDNGYIKEIAWKENRLIFEDQSFSDIALLLERWYGAKIVFKDDSIRNYSFTGIFEKEDLQTVLEFLKRVKKL